MNELIQIFHAHQTLITLGAYYLFSAIVDGMPAPTNGSKGYAWMYSTFHLLAANVDKLKKGNV